MRIGVLITFLVVLFLGSSGFSVTLAEPTLRATRVRGTVPTIDGRLDDGVWQLASASSDFTQKFPHPGGLPTEPTSVRVLYDDVALYIGIDCTQRLAAVQRRLTRRDRDSESDSVTLSLDSRRDRASAFEFSINAAGVLSDRIRFNDTEVSSDWDEIWAAQAALTPTGWSAEMRIPLRALRFDILPSQSFGMQVRRYVSQRQETDEWAFIPRSKGGEVSLYGLLIGLEGLRRGSWLEFRPFLVTRAQWVDLDLHAPSLRFGGSAGIDFKVHLTQNLVLDATINPDFGQVEADQIVLNLTTFEVYYPEKRPFFLEGIDTFGAQFQLFYTRRVGRPPPAPVLRENAPYYERLIQDPSAPPIYGALKLLGTLGRRVTIGAFVALLGKAEGTIEDAGRNTLSRVTEPLRLQSVARLKVAVGDNAHVGFTGTAVNNFDQAGDAPLIQSSIYSLPHRLCPSGDILSFGHGCFHHAYVAALDGRWHSRGGDYTLRTQVMLSASVGGPARTMRDGTVIRSGDFAPGAIVYAAKEGGEHFVAGFGGHVLGPKLDYNDLGYMARQNELRAYAGAEYRTMKPRGRTLETHTRVDLYYRGNFDGLSLLRGGLISTEIKFRNFWSLLTELHYGGAYFDDREVGDGTALERGERGGLEITLSSDRRRQIYGQVWTQTEIVHNGFNFVLEGDISVRPLSQFDLQLLPQASYTFGEPRYVSLGSQPDGVLFGRLRASSLGVIVRATYIFTPRLTLQVYGQLLLAARHYEDFLSFQSKLDGSKAVVHLNDLVPAAKPVNTPDGSEPVLNLSAVLRWEYLPGSVLFLVYTRAQMPTLTYGPGQAAALDLGGFRAGPGTNAIAIKWSYWYG